jgi:hypothetical protein
MPAFFNYSPQIFPHSHSQALQFHSVICIKTGSLENALKTNKMSHFVGESLTKFVEK